MKESSHLTYSRVVGHRWTRLTTDVLGPMLRFGQVPTQPRTSMIVGAISVDGSPVIESVTKWILFAFPADHCTASLVLLDRVVVVEVFAAAVAPGRIAVRKAEPARALAPRKGRFEFLWRAVNDWVLLPGKLSGGVVGNVGVLFTGHLPVFATDLQYWQFLGFGDKDQTIRSDVFVGSAWVGNRRTQRGMFVEDKAIVGIAFSHDMDDAESVFRFGLIIERRCLGLRQSCNERW